MTYKLVPIIVEIGGKKGIGGWRVEKKRKRVIEFFGNASKNQALAWVERRTTQVFPGLADPEPRKAV